MFARSILFDGQHTRIRKARQTRMYQARVWASHALFGFQNDVWKALGCWFGSIVKRLESAGRVAIEHSERQVVNKICTAQYEV